MVIAIVMVMVIVMVIMDRGCQHEGGLERVVGCTMQAHQGLFTRFLNIEHGNSVRKPSSHNLYSLSLQSSYCKQRSCNAMSLPKPPKGSKN